MPHSVRSSSNILLYANKYKDSGTILHVSSGRNHSEQDHDHEVILYSTKTSVVAVDSPVKQLILEMIPENGIAFDEIVTRTGKAKSTISVHLRDLETTGLILLSPDPADQRKKIITLASDPIGRLTNADREPAEEQLRNLSDELPFTKGDIASFFRYTVRVFRTEAMNLGINLDPILEKAGARIGHVLAPLVQAPTLEEKVRLMDQFWQAHQLGSISLVLTDPITLQVKGCFECQDLPVTGHGSCAFDIGVLSSIFASEFKGAAEVCEVECYSSGYDHCTFTITSKARETER